jgi:hypothetical protein
MRHNPRDPRPAFEDALAETAADPQVRRELAAIAEEFAPADLDGLEQP